MVKPSRVLKSLESREKESSLIKHLSWNECPVLKLRNNWKILGSMKKMLTEQKCFASDTTLDMIFQMLNLFLLSFENDIRTKIIRVDIATVVEQQLS